MAFEFNRSVQAISRAQGSGLVLALAFSTVVWSALSLKLGKRPVCLSVVPIAGSPILFITDIPGQYCHHACGIVDLFIQ